MRIVPNRTVLAAAVVAVAICTFVPHLNAQPTFVRVGVSPPAAFGANRGFNAELIAMIADRVGLAIEIETMPQDAILPALVAGEIDVAFGDGVDNSEARALGVAFTQTAVLNTGVLIAPADARPDFRSLEALRGQAVGVTANTTWERQLQDAGVSGVRTYADFSSAMTALAAGEIDLYYTNRAVFLYQQQVQGLHCGTRMVDSYVNTGFPFSSLAVREADTELLAVLNGALTTLRAAGILFSGAFHYHPEDLHVTLPCALGERD
jgi:polar amino acid transport system substrate-binding protein